MTSVCTPACVLRYHRYPKQKEYFSFSLYVSGDPHQFEQKFNYRRPMYSILKYMWTKENYRESIKVTRNKCLWCHENCVFKLWLNSDYQLGNSKRFHIYFMYHLHNRAKRYNFPYLFVVLYYLIKLFSNVLQQCLVSAFGTICIREPGSHESPFVPQVPQLTYERCHLSVGWGDSGNTFINANWQAFSSQCISDGESAKSVISQLVQINIGKVIFFMIFCLAVPE